MSVVNFDGLKQALARVGAPSAEDAVDYRIADALGPAYIARSRSGAPALLIPLDATAATIGRHGGGFSLNPVARLAFEYSGRKEEQSAATLECTDPAVVDAFLVLVVDIATRLSASTRGVTWEDLVSWVDEWQSLFARKHIMTTEQQLGLWGELWVIAKASEIDRLFAAWRGPEREMFDFFLDGAALEIKVSRQNLVHHVSQRQVDSPAGSHDAYVMSLWLGMDPAAGKSLAELVDDILVRISDRVAFLRKIASVGYAPGDRDNYSTRYIPLEKPIWFRAEVIPRVRSVDVGVSQIRYVVTLDPDVSLADRDADLLWNHFCGSDMLTKPKGTAPR